MEYIVREYLVHSGYQESFMALEKENSSSNKAEEDLEFHKEISSLSWKHDTRAIENDHNMDHNTQRAFHKQYSQGMEVDELPYDIDKLRKYSVDDGMLNEPIMRKRTMSIMMDRINDQSENSADIFLIMNFLKERKIIHNMIMDKDYDTALSYFQTHFISYLSKKEISFKKIILCLTTMKYLDSIKNNEYMTAYAILNKLDNSFWNKDITVTMYDGEDRICDYNLEVTKIIRIFNYKFFFNCN